MFEISVKAHFSAAHHLEGYPGECAGQHGHNWEVEVFVSGERLNETGVLMDFRGLKTLVKSVLQRVDHSDLNASAVLGSENPSSENIAKFVYRELSAKLDVDGCRVSRVLVRETPGTRAVYWEP